MVRQAYAHDAVVALQPGGSPNALGGAITMALCYVANFADGEIVTLRILFATDPINEQRVRSLIDEALATGQLTGPDGGVTAWQLRSAAPGNVRPEEQDHAADLIAHRLDACGRPPLFSSRSPRHATT